MKVSYLLLKCFPQNPYTHKEMTSKLKLLWVKFEQKLFNPGIWFIFATLLSLRLSSLLSFSPSPSLHSCLLPTWRGDFKKVNCIAEMSVSRLRRITSELEVPLMLKNFEISGGMHQHTSLVHRKNKLKKKSPEVMRPDYIFKATAI